MLFLLLYFQSPIVFQRIDRIIASYLQKRVWEVDSEKLTEIIKSRYVALEAFAFMTNHVHVAVREVEELGVTRYLQRVLTAYAKYFNLKYETVGHLFQGPYRAVHVQDNNHLLFLSTYIHRNPRDLPGVAGKEDVYEWSSYSDYLGENRFGEMLDRGLVLEQFETPQHYREFVELSIAKEGDTNLELF